MKEKIEAAIDLLLSEQTKLSKEEVGFRNADSPERSCGSCLSYRDRSAGGGECEIVDGHIDAMNLCNKYSENTSIPS